MSCEISIRSELLDLLPLVGHRLNLSRAGCDHLLWLIRRTRVMDWTGQNRAVVYTSIIETAAERGISPRQVNTHERNIVAATAGRVCVNAPSSRRYGRREEKSGRILVASGIELTGLRDLLPDLRRWKAEAVERNELRRARKRELSAMRGRVRRLADAVFSIGDDAAIGKAREIAVRIGGRLPDHEAVDVDVLSRRLIEAQVAAAELEALLLLGKSCGCDRESSDMSEENFRHNNLTNDLRSILKDGGRRSVQNRWGQSASDEKYEGFSFSSPQETGARQINALLAGKAASWRFRSHLPPGAKQPVDADIVNAALRLAPELDISRSAWREACEIIGEYPASLCLLIADRGELAGRVTSPGGYFRSMVRRAVEGRLHINRSIFGLLDKRDRRAS